MQNSSVRDSSPYLREVSEEEWALRVDLSAAYRLAAMHGWVDGISNHFSVRLPGPDHHFLINQFGTVFEEITASNLLKIDLDGRVISGPKDARINKAGFTIHAGIHSLRDDARCILHLHSVHGIAVGAQKAGLLPLSGHALMLYGRIGYHSWEGPATRSDEIPRMLEKMGDKPALMLRNHGTLVAAPTIAQAYYLLFHLEKACEIQCAALAGNRELEYVPDEFAPALTKELAISFPGLAELNWQAMLRMVERRDGGFRN